MAAIWAQAALVFGLALIASLVAHRYRLSTALVEIIVGMVAGSILTCFGMPLNPRSICASRRGGHGRFPSRL